MLPVVILLILGLALAMTTHVHITLRSISRVVILMSFRFLQLVVAHPAFSKDEDLKKFLKEEKVCRNGVKIELQFTAKTFSISQCCRMV